MNVLTIILIILFIFGIALFFKVIKNVFKASIYIFVLLAILFFIGGVMIYTDAADFRQKIQTESLEFVLVNDDTVISTIKIISFANNEVLLHNKATLERKQAEYTSKNYEALLAQNYKMFIINVSVLDSIQTNLEYGEYNLTSSQAKYILLSPSPFDELTGVIAEDQNIVDEQMLAQIKEQLVEDFETDEKLRAAVFSLFIAELFPSQTLKIVTFMKSKEIVVYPETAMFKAIQYVPVSWVIRGEKN